MPSRSLTDSSIVAAQFAQLIPSSCNWVVRELIVCTEGLHIHAVCPFDTWLISGKSFGFESGYRTYCGYKTLSDWERRCSDPVFELFVSVDEGRLTVFTAELIAIAVQRHRLALAGDGVATLDAFGSEFRLADPRLPGAIGE